MNIVYAYNKSTSILEKENDLAQSNLRLIHSLKTKIGIRVAGNDTIRIVRFEEIAYCQANGNYSTIVLKNGTKMTISKTLKLLDDALKDNGFCRIHQSYLVDLHQISEIEQHQIKLITGEMLPVSRARKPYLLNAIGEITVSP